MENGKDVEVGVAARASMGVSVGGGGGRRKAGAGDRMGLAVTRGGFADPSPQVSMACLIVMLPDISLLLD